MATLTIPSQPAVLNFSGGVFSEVTSIVFTNQLPINTSSTVIFSSSQFDGVQFHDVLEITGSTGLNTIQVIGGSLDASQWTFKSWTAATDVIIVQGLADNDIILGSSSRDRLFGGPGDDELDGKAGPDVLSGEDGNDKLYSYGLQGPDALLGGRGIDFALVDRRDVLISLSLDLGDGGGGRDVGDGTVLDSIERVYFAAGMNDDELFGGRRSDILNGFFGNDYLNGGKGDDHLFGDYGADELISRDGEGRDFLHGGEDFDVARIFRQSSALDFVIELPLPGNQNIGDGTFIEAIEKLEFHGGSGNDRVRGGSADDDIYGGGGEDVLRSPSGSAELHGEDGNDLIESASTGAGSYLAGGGGGTDLLIIDREEDANGLFIDLSAAGVTDIGDGTHISGFERLVAAGGLLQDILKGGNLDDNLEGGDGDDYLVGEGGRDALSGGKGNNTLLGGPGDDGISSISPDIIDGGDGVDLLRLIRRFTAGNLTVDISSGDGGINIGDGTRISGIEQIEFFAGTGSNKVTGSGLADTLFGNKGNDVLIGNGGADAIFGGGGINVLRGGGGADSFVVANSAPGDTDTVVGGNGNDTLDFNGTLLAAGVTINLTSGGGGTDIGNGTRISGIEQIDFDGGSGNDNVTGGAFDDVMRGGLGDDVLNGAGGRDRLEYAVGLSGGVVINLSLTSAQDTGLAGVDTISGFEDVAGTDVSDSLTGSAAANVLSGLNDDDRLKGLGGADELRGDDGSDELIGGGGSDILFGEDGKDRLTGNTGADLFKYTAAEQSSVAFGSDIITDFQQGADIIDLQEIAAIASQSDSAFVFIGTDSFPNLPGRLRYTVVDLGADTFTRISGDTNGDGIADMVIDILGAIAFTEADFVL